ncbi:MAG: pyridoxine 5'-phosphate synthase [Phycisphaerales bacterium]
MPQLSVNIDHVATVRNARYRAPEHEAPGASPDIFAEPDPVRAMHEAELGGAHGITVHLREDRRHITDRDVDLIRPLVRVRFNLEMAATDEMVAIAARVRPHSAMLVPEGREEVTTEGGLDVAGQTDRLRDVVGRLKEAGCFVSCFIDAEARQVEACAGLGVDICEIHTGPYAHAFAHHGGDFRQDELDREHARVAEAGRLIVEAGMRFNAGHALNYANVRPIADLEDVAELHIGHAIVSRAVYTGLREAVAEMVALID